MPAHKGNKYNEVWNIETSEAFFQDTLNYILDNKKCRSISEAVVELGQYEEVVSYICKKFPDEEFKSIKRAKDIVKNRLVNQGLDGDAHATMAIFILKNNHNMKDRHDVTTDNKSVNQSIPLVLQDGRAYEDLKDELKPE